MPSMAGTSSSPASVGLAPVVVSRKSGTKTVTENSAAVARNSAALAMATGPVRSRWKGTIGSAARRSRASSAPDRTTVAAMRPRIVRRVPRVARAAPDAGQHQGARRAGQQRGARHVERPVGARGLRRRQAQVQAGEGGDADRQVDEEDPAPAGVVDEHAADERADDGGHGEGRRDVALVAPALARRDEVADGGHRQRHEPAGGRALDGAQDDELRDVLRRAAQRRGERRRRAARPRAGSLRPWRSPSLPHSGVVAAAATT